MAKKTVVQEEEIVHSPKFYDIKEYYDTGRWKKPAVRKAVTSTTIWKITQEEYKEITGEDF